MDDFRRHYRENDILTASQKKLIITLYDSCLRHLEQALASFPAHGRSIAHIHRHLCAAQDILVELMATLDFDRGGTVADNLYQIYRYFHQHIGQANLRKSKEPLQGVCEQLTSLRDAWAEMKEPTATERKSPGGGLDLKG